MVLIGIAATIALVSYRGVVDETVRSRREIDLAADRRQPADVDKSRGYFPTDTATLGIIETRTMLTVPAGSPSTEQGVVSVATSTSGAPALGLAALGPEGICLFRGVRDRLDDLRRHRIVRS